MAQKGEAQFYRLRALLLKNWWLKLHHGYLGIALEILFPIIIVRKLFQRSALRGRHFLSFVFLLSSQFRSVFQSVYPPSIMD